MYNKKYGDDFTIEINSYKYKFNYWFAWDNRKSGFNFYSYAYQTSNSYENYIYLHSASRNNGNMEVFSRKYELIMEENKIKVY